MKNKIRYLFLLLSIPLHLVAKDYTVSVTTTACGTIQSYTMPEGAEMVLVAHPRDGYIFSQWSDGNTENPRIITITSNVAYLAQFVKSDPDSPEESYLIIVKNQGCDEAFEGYYPVGTKIELHAQAEECNYFWRWSDGNTDNPRTVFVDKNMTYTAEFKTEQFIITVESDNETQGSVQVEIQQ